MFAVLLFVVYYLCLVHFFAPISSNQVGKIIAMPVQPIEQQLKKVLWFDVEPQTTVDIVTVTNL